MEKILKLYTYVDGVNDTPFPSKDEQAVLSSFTYSAKRMANAPTISGSIMHSKCLDDFWTSSVYAEFNGERYFTKYTPSSSFSNSDARYKHDVELVSERVVLENVYFLDVVTRSTEVDKPQSNNSNVVFFGDIKEFVNRINMSLEYSNIDYQVVIDEGVTSEEKLVSLKDKFISDALKEIFNSFELKYYFVGKNIHVGDASYVMSENDKALEYGAENSLISISKNRNNAKIITRCSGRGGTTNIPYYYPNKSPYGEVACLYNSVASDNVSIVDWQKFARCGLATTLTYLIKEYDPIVTPLFTIEDAHDRMGDARYGFYSKGYGLSSIGRLEVEPPTIVGVNYPGFYQPDPHYIYYKTIRFDVDAEPQSLIEIKINKAIPIFRGQILARVEKYDEEHVLGEYVEGVSYSPNYYIEGGLLQIPVNGGKLSVFIGLPIFEYEYDDYESKYAQDLWEKKYKHEFDIRIGIAARVPSLEGWFTNDDIYYQLQNVGINLTSTPSIGDKISFELIKDRMPVSANLMPSIYRDSEGEERFYNAKNNEYEILGKAGEYYEFENEFTKGDPKEHIQSFDDITPTIEGITNASGDRVDEIIEFAYDLEDSDEKDDDNNLKHPYFYAKLRKFDGEYGFNLFNSAIEGGNMSFSMKSGVCGGCEWKIQVDKNTLLNRVQVYTEEVIDEDGTIHEKGSLMRDANGNVIFDGEPQDVQNDTRNNEVWVALLKDEGTFGVLMPNATNNYKPKSGDRFVILNISLPQSYIEYAERRLDDEVVKYMSENNAEKFEFSIKFSRIFLEEHKNDLLKKLSENAKLKVKYDDKVVDLYTSSFTYKVNGNDALPEVSVDMAEAISVPKASVQERVESVGEQIVANIYKLDIVEMLKDSPFANTEQPTTFKQTVSFSPNATSIKSEDFEEDPTAGVGWSIYKNQDGDSVLEVDKIFARKSLNINELVINNATATKGTQIISLGGCKIINVIEEPNYYRCYYDNSKNSDFSGFEIGDQAICQTYDSSYKNIVRYYWRLVVGVGYSHVDLSKDDFDGLDAPAMGDTIVQLGNRSDSGRQNAIVISSTPKPSIIQYANINSYSLSDDKIVTKITPDDNKFTGRLDIKPGSVGATNFSDLPEVVEESVYNTFDATEFGSQNILVNSGFAGDYLTHKLNNTTNLNGEDNMYSNNLAHWSHENASVQSSQNSASGFEVVLTDGSISQRLYTNLIAGESYVVSFKASGDILTLSIGGIEKTIELTDSYERYVEKFVATSNTEFVIKDASCAICDIQLERGTVASAWGYSPLDNSSQLAYYQSLKYLSNAIQDGGTSIQGGLILSNMMMLGNPSNGSISEVTSGVSGVSNSDEDVAFWGGGTYEQAVATAYKYATNMSYTPSDDELKNMAKYVVTHGGRSILNDVILRGYVYAKGGKFGNLAVGQDDYGETDMMASHTDELGYQYDLRFNPMRLKMEGRTTDYSEYESVTIAPNRNADRIDSGGLMNLTARRGYKALVIEEGSIDGLRPTSTVTSSSPVDIISHTTIVNGTSDQILVLPNALYEGDGKVYHIINAKKGGYLKIMSYNSAINNCIGYEVSTVNTGQVLTLTANERSLWAICVDGEWFLHK